MNEMNELKTLMDQFKKGLLTQDDLTYFVWSEYNNSNNGKIKLGEMEQFFEMLTQTCLITIDKIRMRSRQVIPSLNIDFEKEILNRNTEEKTFSISEIVTLLKGRVSHATLNNHFNSGKLRGKRISARKAEITESDLIKYVKTYHPALAYLVKPETSMK